MQTTQEFNLNKKNNGELRLTKSHNLSSNYKNYSSNYQQLQSPDTLKSISQYHFSDRMASKKSPNNQTDQLSNTLFNIHLASQTKDNILPKSRVSSSSGSGSSSSKLPLSKFSVKNSTSTKVIDDKTRDIKSPIITNRIVQPATKLSMGKINNSEMQKKITRPQSSGGSVIKTSESFKENQQQSSKLINTTTINTQQYIKAGEMASPSNNVDNANMSKCKICNRNFLTDRLVAHENACTKLNNKKRKPFVARKTIEGQPIKVKTKVVKAKSKNNWRKTHEEFVANIRAARETQKFLDSGGKLQDLPPPPPMDTSHLIPCPHCGRKFSDSAADRHIPLCKEKALRAKLTSTNTKINKNNTKTGIKLQSNFKKS